MVDDDRFGLLPLSPETGVGLLIQFQRPRHRVPDDGAAAVLQIQTVTCGGGLNQCDRDFAIVPVGDVGIGLDLPTLESLHDAVAFVLVPVSDQHRFSVLRFDQIFQCVQLVRMYPHHAAAVGIYRTAGKLCQLTAQDTRICCRDGIAGEIQTHILLHVFVDRCRRFIQLHGISGHDQLRHLQVVGGFHGNADVGNLAVYLFLCTRSGRIGKAVPVRGEVGIAVLPDSLAEAFSFVKQPELRPQIHETVAAGRTGQPDNALHERSHLSQCLETLGLMVLEGTQLVDHHHIEVKRRPTAFDEPLHVLAVDDIQIGFLPESCKALVAAAENQTVGQPFEMIPLSDFCRPAILAYTNGGDDQGLSDFKSVEHQVVQCRQRYARLA